MKTNEIAPAFLGDSVNIFLGTNDAYIYGCIVAVQSILEHADPTRNYDIVLLGNKITPANNYIIKAFERRSEHISIRFFDISDMLLDAELTTRTHGYFRVDVYIRLFSPLIFSQYSKIIYLDSDVLVLHDIAELYNINLGNEWIGGCRDYGITIRARTGRIEPVEYFEKELGLMGGPINYINSGVLLLNLDVLRRENVCALWMDTIKNGLKDNDIHYEKRAWIKKEFKGAFIYPDQDVINKICCAHIIHLDTSWNYAILPNFYMTNFHLLEGDARNKFLHDRTHPKIIHYVGTRKPWKTPSSELCYIWWKYAKLVPFYENVLYENIKNNAEESIKHDVRSSRNDELKTYNIEIETAIKSAYTLLKDIALLPDYHRKLKRINFRILYTWGEKRKKLLARKKKLKNIVHKIEKFIKSK